MNKKRVVAVTAALFVVLVAASVLVSASISVGTKEGDWIEYQVATSGSPPGDHNAQWARMEVKNVQGTVINLNVTTQFQNGTFLVENVTLNLETGQIGDAFFIPADLTEGESFFDAHQGNITIESVQQKTYGDAPRSVVSGRTPQTTFYWDQQTGVLVEAHSTYPEYNFSIDTVMDKTNMWQPQVIGLEDAVLYVFAAVATGVVAVIAYRVAVRHRRT